MSDNIPFDIQQKIMKMFPVKSLIQFRSVSKLWKSVIDSSEFFLNYHVNNPRLQHHQLIRYVDSEERYVTVLDDDTFPQNKSFLTLPLSVNQIDNTVRFMKVMGSSQGLFCFYNRNLYPNEDSGTAVIWNPSIRKSVVINVPNVLDRPYATIVGFAVCPHTNDPMLVKITYNGEHFYFQSNTPWQIEVYTLSSGVWRTLSIDMPSPISLIGDQEVLEGFIYFLSVYRTMSGGNKHLHESDYVIMSFDTINEEFTKISLPFCTSLSLETCVVMSKLRGSLVVMTFNTEYRSNVTDVWMMDGVTKSFNQIFCIDPPDGYIGSVLGFRKSGEAIIIMKNDYDNSDDDSDDAPYSEYMNNIANLDDYESVFVYDPYSEQMDNIGISGKPYPLFANCYTETLLLLDQ